MSQAQQQTPLAVIMIHDACPAFSTKIFKFTTELEKLGVRYNTALVPFFNEKQDFPRFLGFVDKIESCKGEICYTAFTMKTEEGSVMIFIQQKQLQKKKYGWALKYC